MGGTSSTPANTDGRFSAGRHPLVIITVPHAKCMEEDVMRSVGTMTAADLKRLAQDLDAVRYGRDLRMCDRRAMQAALMLQAALVEYHPDVRIALFANTVQVRADCDNNRRQNCTLEQRVMGTLSTLLAEASSAINIDVHSFPTKGLQGDVLASNDPRGLYMLTLTGAEMGDLTSTGAAAERMGSSVNLFLTLFPRHGVPSALAEFYEDTAAYPLDRLAADATRLAAWAVGRLRHAAG